MCDIIATPAGTEIPPRYRRDTAGTGNACHETEALDWAKQIFAELPVAGLLSARPIRCDPQRGRIIVAFQARREFCHLVGSVQGEMPTEMLDLAMSFAMLYAPDDGHVVPSSEVKTSFIAPARPGAIVGEGMLVRKGRSIRHHGRQARRPARQPSRHCERHRPDPPARRTPPVWMKPGDVLEVEISGSGILRNPVVAE
jgi:acyl-coenzyme A thioesterase PaaI-like protein